MLIDPTSSIGMILSLLAWLRSEAGGQDILQNLNSKDVIGSYLEWLRRKDHLQLISEINACKNDLLSQLAEIGPQLSALAGQIYSVAGDPANPRTMRIRSGAIFLDAAKSVFELWPRFLQVIREQRKIPWLKVIQIVNQWSGQNIGFGYSLPTGYSDFLNRCFKQMISDLPPLAGENQAVNRWIWSGLASIAWTACECMRHG
jgi:hypothetical protein